MEFSPNQLFWLSEDASEAQAGIYIVRCQQAPTLADILFHSSIGQVSVVASNSHDDIMGRTNQTPGRNNRQLSTASTFAIPGQGTSLTLDSVTV